VIVFQKPGQVTAADGAITDFKTTGFVDLVSGNSGSAKLWHDQLAVVDDLLQVAFLYLTNNLVCTESPFASRAPDIDSFGVEDQQPCVMAVHVAAQNVESHFVVGGNQYRTVA